MRMYRIGDSRAEAYLLRAEEVLAEARAFSALRAEIRDTRPPRRPARVWLGTLLLALGQRLLASTPEPAAPA
jgi:hypothetical protein